MFFIQSIIYVAKIFPFLNFNRQARPRGILDTESNEVKVLTRQVADSLTPPNMPNEGNKIEQELLDVLRGHRIISKSERLKNIKTESLEEESEKKSHDKYQKSSKKQQANIISDAGFEKTTAAFS